MHPIRLAEPQKETVTWSDHWVGDRTPHKHGCYSVIWPEAYLQTAWVGSEQRFRDAPYP
jgi:hypothetical protein